MFGLFAGLERLRNETFQPSAPEHGGKVCDRSRPTISRQIRQFEQDFLKNGGLREATTRARINRCNRSQ